MECSHALQQERVVINLRLSDTWMRDYQVLEGRTHPNISMSLNGGLILTGIKLNPQFGINEMYQELRNEIGASIGGRRGKKKNKRKRDIRGDFVDV